MSLLRLPIGSFEAHFWSKSSKLSLATSLVTPRFALAAPSAQQTRSCSSASKPSSQPSKVRTRFAPSPTGYLHLGGLRTALYNHLLARQSGGSWTLRIEDTDQTRYVEGAEEALIRSLKWAELDFDEGPGRDGGRGPYLQSQRKKIYDRHLDRLVKEGKAYHCFCSTKRLETTRKALKMAGSSATYDRKCLGLSEDETRRKLEDGETSIVRFKSSTDSLTQVDLVYNQIRYDKLPIEDFVLRKSDGLPTYHFANVVDDHEMGVTHVLRGEEWLSSTPKHLALYSALGFTPPQFAHLPLLMNADGSKLSKRFGDVRVEDYQATGYEPEALLNFVALLGWSPSGSRKKDESSDVLTVAQLVKMVILLLLLERILFPQFSLKNINKNRPTISKSKLDFLNRAHIQLKVKPGNEKGHRDIAERLREYLTLRKIDRFAQFFISSSEPFSSQYLIRVVSALSDRIHTLKGVPNMGRYFFEKPDFSTVGGEQLFHTVKLQTYIQTLEATLELLQNLPPSEFKEEKIDSLTKSLNSLIDESRGRKSKQLMNPLRHALTGQTVGAGVATTISILGKDETIERLRFALARVQ
ncbi:glutamate-tRNA ligase [Meredithblackwellia eburnea MCA 4105]